MPIKRKGVMPESSKSILRLAKQQAASDIDDVIALCFKSENKKIQVILVFKVQNHSL